MGSNKKITIFLVSFVLIGILITVFFPQEQEKNSEALVRIGAGSDVSGILMEETVESLSNKYIISENLESSSFQDC